MCVSVDDAFSGHDRARRTPVDFSSGLAVARDRDDPRAGKYPGIEGNGLSRPVLVPEAGRDPLQRRHRIGLRQSNFGQRAECRIHFGERWIDDLRHRGPAAAVSYSVLPIAIYTDTPQSSLPLLFANFFSDKVRILHSSIILPILPLLLILNLNLPSLIFLH